MKKLLLILPLLCGLALASAQYSQYQLGDSASRVYPYKLPILGKKAYENGFDIPKPVGFMLNYFTASQNIVIPEIAVGFSNGITQDIPLTDISDLIEFEEINAVAHSISVRPDVWIFPFLDVYGIFGKTFATTSVKISSPFQMNSIAKLEGISYGFGTTGAFGLGKYFVVLDGNWVWTSMSNFKDPVKSGVFSQRIGRSFKVGKNPESNVAFWAGGMRVKMGNYTQGTISLNDALPQEVWDRKDQAVAEYWVWYDDLGPLEKATADKVLTPVVNKIDEADGSGTVEYRLLKEPKQEWNMIIGGQFQLNTAWQFRVEGGIIGDRKSLLLSTNYRFGI